MSIRGYLHKVVDKSFNTVDAIRNTTRKASKTAAQKVAERLSKDPTDIKLAKLEKERQAIIDAKNERKPNKTQKKNEA